MSTFQSWIYTVKCLKNSCKKHVKNRIPNQSDRYIFVLCINFICESAEEKIIVTRDVFFSIVVNSSKRNNRKRKRNVSWLTTERSRDEWKGLCEFVFSGLLNPLAAWLVLNVLNLVNILLRESTSVSREKKNRTAECLRIWFVIHAKPDYIGVELRGWSVLRHLWFIARVLWESIASTYV